MCNINASEESPAPKYVTIVVPHERTAFRSIGMVPRAWARADVNSDASPLHEVKLRLNTVSNTPQPQLCYTNNHVRRLEYDRERCGTSAQLVPSPFGC